MFCPACGTQMPDDAQFCPACGADTKAGAVASRPAVPIPAAPAPTAPMPVAVPQYAPAPQTVAPAPPKKKTGLVIAIVLIVLLLLCCCGSIATALLVPAIRDLMPWNAQTSVEPQKAADSGTSTAPSGTADKDIDAAQKVVEAYYAAFNAGDLEGIKATLTPEVAADITADWFDVGTQSTFEFTRGTSDGTTIAVFGRESDAAFGSGGDGGVKFTLVSVDGQWRITAWTGADRMQIEGTDTTGSSSGVSASLTDASARDVVTRLLDARMKGNANVVRQLTTASFQSAYGDIWLDGRDNSEYFLAFRITKVVVSGDLATVETSEDWNSGTEGAIYTVVRQNGVLLVNVWN
jgi:hypothetical protein